MPESDFTLRIHLRCFQQPEFSADVLLEALNFIYRPASIAAEIITNKSIRDFPPQRDLCIGVPDQFGCSISCPAGAQPSLSSPDHQQLFDLARDFAVETGEIVVCVVKRIHGIAWGCSTHPQGQPGVVITSGAPAITMAHEIGHVLGLSHSDDAPNDRSRLMYEDSNKVPYDPPRTVPTLTDIEIQTMRESAPAVGSLSSLWFHLSLPAPDYDYLSRHLPRTRALEDQIAAIAQVAPPEVALSAVRLAAHLSDSTRVSVGIAGSKRGDSAFVRAAAAETLRLVSPKTTDKKDESLLQALSAPDETAAIVSEGKASGLSLRASKALQHLERDPHPTVRRLAARTTTDAAPQPVAHTL